MSRSYKATGINLKGMPIGETDRLLTVLTVEHGLVRAIVPGARKHKSRLAGRSSQFVVNELFIIKGKQLDKLVQAETVRSFPGLSTDLARLTASQYLAELVLCQALSEQPQGDLFALLVEQLQQLEQATGDEILVCLSYGIFRLLRLAGVAPEVGQCNISQQVIQPNFTQPDWRIGFSAMSGGIVRQEEIGRQLPERPRVRASQGYYMGKGGNSGRARERSRSQPQTTLITAEELALLQQLANKPEAASTPDPQTLYTSSGQGRLLWQRVERLLRQYAEYHFDRPILSATLIDTCFPVAVRSE